MKSHKKIIAAIATTAAISLGAVTPYQDSISLAELMTIPQIYQHESEAAGGKFEVGQVKGEDDLLEKINNIIETRVPTQDEKITINGEEITPEQYKTLRDELLPKVESKSLLERITE